VPFTSTQLKNHLWNQYFLKKFNYSFYHPLYTNDGWCSYMLGIKERERGREERGREGEGRGGEEERERGEGERRGGRGTKNKTGSTQNNEHFMKQ
jgi:hypothetical protein